MMDEATRNDGEQQMVYHRTPEFSRRLLSCESLLKHACGADSDARIVILTGSGTAAMEASVLNLFAPGEEVLVVQGGDFGFRFGEIARLHGINVVEVRLEPGRQLTADDLRSKAHDGLAGMLINHHETSTGTLYDLALAARFCRERGMFLVVDAIGSFLADPLAMSELGIDALIFSSQKALALPPGLSFVVLNSRAQMRVQHVPRRSYYFDFRRHLADILRGQTPFTPAIGLLCQLERRLERLMERGVQQHVETIRSRAADFRGKIAGLPLALFSEAPSNAVTALAPLDVATPQYYVSRLASDRRIYVCPNGGALGGRIFRVGHLGDLSPADNTRLAGALRELALANHAACAQTT
jgi:aspartate aminotransferase-like enzyme